MAHGSRRRARRAQRYVNLAHPPPVGPASDHRIEHLADLAVTGMNPCAQAKAGPAPQAPRGRLKTWVTNPHQQPGGWLRPEASDQLDLNGDVERQLCKPDSAASVPSGALEDLDQQIGASIDDRWSLVEAGRDIHHSEYFDDPRDAVEVTEFGLQGSQDRQTCLPRGIAALLQSQVSADLAADDLVAVDRSVPSHVHDPVVYDASQVVTRWRKHGRKHDSELLKSLSDHARSIGLEGTDQLSGVPTDPSESPGSGAKGPG